MDRNIGVYDSEEAALVGVVQRLVDGLHPKQIYLFGSRARNDHRPDSDFDLLVITNVEDGENGRDFGWVRRPLRGSGVGFDIMPVRIDDFETELHSELSVIPSVMRKAVKVYDVEEGFPLAAARCLYDNEFDGKAMYFIAQAAEKVARAIMESSGVLVWHDPQLRSDGFPAGHQPSLS